MKRPWLPVLLAMIAIASGWILLAEREAETAPVEPGAPSRSALSPSLPGERPSDARKDPIASVPFEGEAPDRENPRAAPRDPPPSVAVESPGGDRDPVVTGRLVRRDGTAWPPVQLRVWPNLFPDPDGGRRSQKLDVAEGGFFRLVLRLPCPPGGTRSYRLILPNDTFGRSAMETSLDLSREFPPGETDIGDVVLDHGILLAAGIVIDQDGKPVGDAWVRARQTLEGKMRGLTRTLRTSGASRTGADGRFELWLLEKQEAPEGRLAIWALHDDHPRCPDLACPVGARGLRLVLPRSGGLAGSFRFGPEQCREHVHAELVTSAGTHRLRLAEDGSFEARRLPPGELTLRARLQWNLCRSASGWDLVIDGIEIAPNQTCRDPRLQQIEVPGQLHHITLTVVDERGIPIVGTRVRRTDLGPRHARDASFSGSLEIGVRALPLDVEISAYGYGSQRIEGLDEDCTVILKRGVPVRLIASGPVKGGTNPGWQLGINLWRRDGAGRRIEPHLDIPRHRNYFSPEGEVALRLPPGSYEAGFVLVVIQTGDRLRSIGFAASPPPRFTLHDGEVEQRIPITIPEAKLREVLRDNLD